MAEVDELARAIWDDDIRAVKRLLQQRPERVHEASPSGVTPLMTAALSENRSARTVRVLLEAGADARAATSDNSTVLHFAVGVMAPGCWGRTPARVIGMLADAGAPLEERQQWGWTPLMAAIMEGTLAEIRAMLEAGADPNVFFPMHSMPEFIRGRSALSATLGAEVSQTKLLLAHGADLHARDRNGQTALEVALQVLEESRDAPDFCRKVMQSIRVLKKAAAST